MKGNGFTLVELMVVIAVMALIAGAAVLTIASPGDGPKDSATRFATRLAAARDEAVLRARPVSAWVTASGYGFEQYAGGQWQPITAKPFAGANWPEGTRVSLDDSSSARARVRFDSLGLPESPARFSLAADGRTVAIAVAANGDVRVE
ncbi:MAG: GspH/FimT family pseudopilin [Pseudomonadota bacterium]|nr:GspH/FimT family pseudopilin [Pseudomonadota bacterium]